MLNVVCVVYDDMPVDGVMAMPYLDAEPHGHWLRFPNSTISRPLCAPSRSSIHTGLTVRRHNILMNEDSDTTIADNDLLGPAMKRAGYSTGLFGKYHLPINGIRTLRKQVPPGWDEWNSHVRGGQYTDFGLNENGVVRDYFGGEYLTDVLFSRAAAWIAAAREPFFCYVAPTAPHNPAVPAARHQNAYTVADLPTRPNVNEADVSDKPPFFANIPPLTQAQLDAENTERVAAWCSLRAVDEGFETLIEALTAAGQLETTVIVALADNSNAFGSHRLTKKMHLYQECITAHMMVRYPGAAARTSTAIVANIDVAPTLVDLADSYLPNTPDGMSMVPLLNGTIGDDRWRSEVLIERPDPSSLQARGLRGKRWKYVLYDTGIAAGFEELYDLEADPYELTNVAQSHPAVVAASHQRLLNLESAMGLPAWPPDWS